MKTKQMKLRAFFSSCEEFKQKLDVACTNAETDWETRFCADLIERYNEFGADLLLSTSAANKLNELQKSYKDRGKQ